MRKFKLKIKGTYCLSCKMLIKDALGVMGVKNSKINNKTEFSLFAFVIIYDFH